jgi:DNA adenine methylase
MAYAGGKGRIYQVIVNLMPPHATYIETHLGGGAVMSAKRPAARNIGIDLDPRVIENWRRAGRDDIELHHADASRFLLEFPFTGNELVYCDPPYWPAARRRPRCYTHDYTEADHHRLLDVLLPLPCRVMLSGYRCETYDARLGNWLRLDIDSGTQVGRVSEGLWLNFDPGPALHDYAYLGADFREREAIRRRRETHVRRIAAAGAPERFAILSDLAEAFPAEAIAAVERLPR